MKVVFTPKTPLTGIACRVSRANESTRMPVKDDNSVFGLDFKTGRSYLLYGKKQAPNHFYVLICKHFFSIDDDDCRLKVYFCSFKEIVENLK